jgi:ABC-type glycerol-3-phosphate transport system permease component
MAASTLMLVPVLLLFFVANKYFVKGIATSGLAGR